MTDSALLHKLKDEQYLYRLASTYAWDEAVEFCDKSILGLETAVEAATTSSNASAMDSNAEAEYFDEYLDTQFDRGQNGTHLSVHEWLRFVYKQITFADQWGNTPLHSASFCKPPVDMIRALFRLARALRRFASATIDRTQRSGNEDNNDDNIANDDEDFVDDATSLIIWAATCKDGSTPFLVASSTGASTDVLHCFLDEIEYYNDNDWIVESSNPKEWARKTTIRPDFSGNTPLMGWMCYHEMWIKRQLDPASCNVRDLPKLADRWDLTARMLQFATKDNGLFTTNHHATTLTLIQQCASISLYCPVSILEWAVSPHRQGIVDISTQSWTSADVCASIPDRTTGKLPFHLAMEATLFSFDSNFSIYNCRSSALLEKNRIQMIKKLLAWYPDAANVPFQLMKCDASAMVTATNNEGKIRRRSPFLQAISSGMTWWHTLNTADCCEENGADYMGLVQLLWRLNPGEATSKRDEVSGLYPFMLAASAVTTKASCSDDRLLVDTTFNLLKKDPELVSGALMTTKSEGVETFSRC